MENINKIDEVPFILFSFALVAHN